MCQSSACLRRPPSAQIRAEVGHRIRDQLQRAFESINYRSIPGPRRCNNLIKRIYEQLSKSCVLKVRETYTLSKRGSLTDLSLKVGDCILGNGIRTRRTIERERSPCPLDALGNPLDFVGFENVLSMLANAGVEHTESLHVSDR